MICRFLTVNQGILAKIREHRVVLVYTDACICDTPIDRNLFAKRRIYPVGLYVGDDENAREMDRHFPQSIIRESIESLVEVMLTRNKRKM